MSCIHNKVTEAMNDLAKDIMTIKDLEMQVPLLQQFDEVRKPIYKLIETLQEAKQKQPPEPSIYLPDVTIKARLTPSDGGLFIERSREYADSLTSLTSEYRDMIHDFIHVYASTMVSAFVDRSRQTTVTHSGVTFGKFKFNNITLVAMPLTKK